MKEYESQRGKISLLLADEKHETVRTFSAPEFISSFDVHTAVSYSEAAEKALRILPRIIVSEMVLPGGEGIDLMLEIRSRSKDYDPLFIIFTDIKDAYAQVASFKAGADDYIMKTKNSRVLAKRINAVINRSGKQKDADRVLTVKDITLNPERHSFTKNGIEIDLPRKEFNIFKLLAANQNIPFSRNAIKHNVWNHQTEVNMRTIDVHVRNLRKKIGDGIIKTVKGKGYMISDQ